MILLAVPVLPLAVLYASVFVVTGRTAQLALDVLLIVATGVAGLLWRRRLWERPVVRRLAEWQSSNPELGEVGVAIADADVRRASIVLCAHTCTRATSVPATAYPTLLSWTTTSQWCCP